MCGIAGFIDPGATAEQREEAVRAMCASMVHRGPDDSGMASKGSATIGMRRLAIFDPVNGHQPMTSPDGRYSLVFNGAIYNFQELQPQLESEGWVFRTRCDTEVLLAALALWGKPAVRKLRGMFSFALWDAVEQTLFAARDPLGIKPFYYTGGGPRLLFASEISALLVSGAAQAEFDPLAVVDYLGWFAVPAPRTIYKGILCLQPGESLTFSAGKITIEVHWSFAELSGSAGGAATREEFIHGLREKLEDSIRAHVLADVPVGAFLSGGLDSAVVAGLMSRATGTALKTFSIGFEETNYSEADDAEATAKFFGAVHHTRILTGEEVARDLDKFLAACDQPTGDGINTYYASQTAQEGGVKVALSGLGGDELFGGYPSFRAIPALAGKLPAWLALPGSVRKLVTGILDSGGARARKLADFLANARDAHELGALQRRVIPHSTMLKLVSPDLHSLIRDSLPFHPRLGLLRSAVGTDDLFQLVSAWELNTYMSDVLLRDSDVMSMRHSLELRVPFIDRYLVEWLWRQPSRFKIDLKRPKRPLIDATADILPPGLLKRRKRGFTFPFAIWMRKELRPFLEHTFSPGRIAGCHFISPGPAEALWANFIKGSDDREWSRVWSVAVLIEFLNDRARIR